VSLNPALQDAGFCPRCGAPAEVDFPRSLRCTTCDYIAFYNPKPVGCAVPRAADGRVWLARRGFDPGKGRWSMPGGFVDLGETVQAAILRELEEELCVGGEVGALIGVYSRADAPVVVIVFEVAVDATPRATREAPEVRAFDAHDLPWDELAFPSDRAALEAVLGRA
jgi:ADP-ribose pyrophosphatase YjhB (NUDIX family)